METRSGSPKWEPEVETRIGSPNWEPLVWAPVGALCFSRGELDFSPAKQRGRLEAALAAEFCFAKSQTHAKLPHPAPSQLTVFTAAINFIAAAFMQ